MNDTLLLNVGNLPLPESLLSGFETVRVGTIGEAIEHARALGVDVVFAGPPLSVEQAETLLESLQVIDKRLPVVFYLPRARAIDAVRLNQLGAFHCFIGEAGMAGIADVLRLAAERDTPGRDAGESRETWRSPLIGASAAMQQVFELIRLVGNRRSTVLITGETGTGKELIARAIHAAGDRSQAAMVAVNCSAIPEHLLEAELFGHTKGAFTGAINQRIGRFEQAHRGTIFLDEIADMPLDLQVKMLRVLQEREIQRLGSSASVVVDCRVIAATNRDLREAVMQGQFRSDLFYRLNVVPLRVPALRERLSDIPLLVDHFIEKICKMEGLPPKRITPDALDLFYSYSWPGNVRELEHAVEMAIALCGDRRVLTGADFRLSRDDENPGSRPAAIELPESGLDFEDMMTHIQRTILDQALRRCGGNKARAADLLHMKRTTLLSKVKALHYCAG